MTSIISPILSAPSISALSACSAIAANVSAEIYSLPDSALNPEYQYAKNHYWSSAAADNSPACVVFPTSADDVAGIVEVLIEFPDVKYAVKVGGHNANSGFSSTDGGILLSFSDWKGATLNADGVNADVRPGGRWEDVISDLEPSGRAVVGGRIGDVGVGLLLGGGLSFLSTQYGMACDSIVNYEVVLANATIINANPTTNSDLFWALKGGGNQFGIVTKYTIKTVPMGQVWGGTRSYSGLLADKLLEATQDWTENFHDPKGSTIVTAEIAAANVVDIFTVFFFYDGPTPPAGVFDKFDAIPALTSTTVTQTYSSLLISNNAFSIYGFRWLLRAATLPNLPSQNGTDLYISAYNLWKSYLSSQGLPALFQLGFTFSIGYQPIPTAIPAASLARNPLGNPMNLAAADGDKMWMTYTISWLTNISDAKAEELSKYITNDINRFVRENYGGVRSTHYVEGVGKEDEGRGFVYLNDAMGDQKPLESYGAENYRRLKAIEQRYDPEGFIPARTGGFKLR